ncbi:type I polyketide synthase, partial [Dietzia sp. B19]|uniref:type I polyketide synthase n=1 Tax=Dietzia sp. B19 TaxID=1630632 RepID=UPI0015FC5F1E
MTDDNSRLITALRRSLKEQESLAAQVADLRRRADEPIAVVSLACRYPGGCDSPEQLWQSVLDGDDLTSDLPVNRGWDLDQLIDPSGERPGSSMTDRGGFLHDADRFDAQFFNMSPNEARATDPQHRLLLEAGWEAFERMGLTRDALSESATGVYIGAAYQGYGQDWYEAPTELLGPLVAGMSTSIMSGRIAYHLGLRGPALTIDTACSSSLVAIHEAANALRRGDCELALAGGAAVMAAPISLVGFTRQRGVAADGRCKAFGEAADGMGLGEGVGVIVLERLSRAREHGHPILALIEGSALNQDGASNGISAPSGPAQVEVIRAAVASAGLAVSDIDAVEAHGTGTRLGDPIEANALIEAYGSERGDAAEPLYIGSLKSNVGHAQAASGVGGLIKMIMALRHGWLPGSLHADPLTPLIDWEGSGVEVLTEGRAWSRRDGAPRRCGVSSFGLSGTNAHIVLAGYEPEEETEGGDPEPGDDHGSSVLGDDAPVMWVLSARSDDALQARAAELVERLAAEPHPDIRSIAHSLLRTRSVDEHRAVVIGRTAEELIDGLRGLGDGRPGPAVVRGRATGTPDTVLIFPGQGAQYAGMGRELMDRSPEFAASMAECAAVLEPHLGTDVLALLRSGDESWLDRVELVQSALWAVMVSLARLWLASGLRPAAIVGHSQGEIAAAVVAGVLTPEDGARVVARRALALRRIVGTGGMLAVRAAPSRVGEICDLDRGDLAVAVQNGMATSVLAGPDEALDRAEQALSAEGVDSRRVSVDYPSHSPSVELLRDELREALRDVDPGPAELALYSTVSTNLVDGPEMDGDYWFDNLHHTVRMAEVVERLRTDGIERGIECSPHPVLIGALDIEGQETLRRTEPGIDAFVRALATAWADGAEIDLGFVVPRTPHTIELPTYPFQRSSFWLASRSTRRHESESAGRSYAVKWQPQKVDSAGDRGIGCVLSVAGTVDGGLAAALRETFGGGYRSLEFAPGVGADELGTLLSAVDPAVPVLSL